jgi:hypothetical protein
MPVFSIALFLMVSETVLWMVDFKPTINRNGVDIPFWAKNAGTFERALEQLAMRVSRLTRDVDAYQEDFRLFYKLRPNINIKVPFYDVSGMTLYGSFPDWQLVTDERGRRCQTAGNSISEAEKGTAQVDIAFMGGSSFFGWGTDYENTCVSIFESSANQLGARARFRCVNHAVPGYAMSQQLHLLKRMITENKIPRFIILDATSNCDVPSSQSDAAREKNRFSPAGRLRFVLGKLRFFTFLESWVLRLLPNRPEQSNTSMAARIPIETYDDFLSEFIALTKKYHIRLICVGMCVSPDYIERMKAVAAKETIACIDFYELISTFSDCPEKIPFVETEKQICEEVYSEPALIKMPSLYLLFPDKCHPNPTGHRVLAHQLLRMTVTGENKIRYDQ